MSYQFDAYPTELPPNFVNHFSLSFASYDPATHKAVPKDAIVLDLAESGVEFGGNATPQNFLRAAAERENYKNTPRTVLLRWIADQIEEQTTPPKPAEPGLWGRVTDKEGHTWVRTITTGSRRWACFGDGLLVTRLDWDEINVAEVWDKGVSQE